MIIGVLLRWLLRASSIALTLAVILLFSLIGIAGSYGVAWFGIRVNTFAQLARRVRQPARQAVPDLRHPAARRA